MKSEHMYVNTYACISQLELQWNNMNSNKSRKWEKKMQTTSNGGKGCDILGHATGESL